MSSLNEPHLRERARAGNGEGAGGDGVLSSFGFSDNHRGRIRIRPGQQDVPCWWLVVHWWPHAVPSALWVKVGEFWIGVASAVSEGISGSVPRSSSKRRRDSAVNCSLASQSRPQRSVLLGVDNRAPRIEITDHFSTSTDALVPKGYPCCMPCFITPALNQSMQGPPRPLAVAFAPLSPSCDWSVCQWNVNAKLPQAGRRRSA